MVLLLSQWMPARIWGIIPHHDAILASIRRERYIVRGALLPIWAV